MDRTGKGHMARRAGDCKPNLEQAPTCSAVIAVLHRRGSCANSHTVAIRFTDLPVPYFFLETPARPIHRLPTPQLAGSTEARITIKSVFDPLVGRQTRYLRPRLTVCAAAAFVCSASVRLMSRRMRS